MRLPRRLRARLVISHVLVAVAALGTVLAAVSVVGPGYFADAMGHRPGDAAGQAMDQATLAAFQEAIGTALVAGAAIGLLAAVAVAVALATRIATPLTHLVVAARRIASGHYAERVPPFGEGEIGELAGTFNAMAVSLEATERRRVELVGDVAHELRTPLASLDGFLEGLQDGVVQAEPRTWDKLRGETARLTRLVNDLSELWRAEARQLPLTIESVDLAEIMRDVIEAVVPPDRRRLLQVHEEPIGQVMARADHDRTAQILVNLVSNAVRYSPPGSPIAVGGRRAVGEVVVWIKDAGVGLTPDQRVRVFERFYRVDPSRSRELGGSGVGLAITAALAAAMGGRVWAESDGSSTGSTFLLALPAA